MSKIHSKEEIIIYRLCGLKHFDAAVSKVGKMRIIEETIKEFNNSPYILPNDPWERLGWAHDNVIKEILNNDTIVIGCNFDEMYDEREMLYMSDLCEISLPDTSARRRKKE
jgi:hypothetical protein